MKKYFHHEQIMTAVIFGVTGAGVAIGYVSSKARSKKKAKLTEKVEKDTEKDRTRD